MYASLSCSHVLPSSVFSMFVLRGSSCSRSDGTSRWASMPHRNHEPPIPLRSKLPPSSTNIKSRAFRGYNNPKLERDITLSHKLLSSILRFRTPVRIKQLASNSYANSNLIPRKQSDTPPDTPHEIVEACRLTLLRANLAARSSNDHTPPKPNTTREKWHHRANRPR